MLASSSSLLLLLILLVPFLSFLLFLCSSSIHSKSPISYPLVGCLPSFYYNRRRLLGWYTDLLSSSPTQTIVLSRFAAPRTILTANPRNVEYILKTKFHNFPKGSPFTAILGDFLGNGIFNVDGEMWYNQRKILIHEFNPSSLREHAENVLKEEVEKKLLPLLELAASEGKIVDLQDLLRRLAFELICKFSLGFDPCCLEYDSLDTPHPIVEAFDVASDICARRGAAPLSAIWRIKRFLGVGSEKRLGEAIRIIHEFIDEIVGKKKRRIGDCRSTVWLKDGPESNLLSKMVLVGIGEHEIRDTIISFIMAGRDTTSAAMTWLLHLLSSHPDVETEVVREVGLVKLYKYESLKELRWLKACICESMRLFPPVAWDSKHALVEDLLPDGTRVRAGDRVTYFPYGMGRMENLWGPDPLEFKPERWVSERSDGSGGRIKALKNVDLYKFPVFQAGPRVCLGKELAFIQMKFVVASILKRFTITPEDPHHRPVFVPLLTAHMAGGFKVFVHRRQ